MRRYFKQALRQSVWCFVGALAAVSSSSASAQNFDVLLENKKMIEQLKVGPKDWPQWAGTPYRNNVCEGTNIPTAWNVETGDGIRWSMPLGSETYGNPVVANGKVYVGTNNGNGYAARYPNKVDLGCLVCFNEADGKFLWQHSNEKLPTGRVHDWPNQGICAAPLVDGDRLWYVTSRGEVVCLDTEGFLDGENDGTVQDEISSIKPDQKALVNEKIEADVVWRIDMMKQLKVSQHNMCSCSVTAWGDYLLVNTGNGVDEGHKELPQPAAASFMVCKRSTGEVLWTDNSPGDNVLHGQWSSPACGVLGGVAQAIYGGGDGWLYSFALEGENGKAKLLWKFDCNPKESIYMLNKATRNHLIATPVIYDGLVYVAVGEDPEHGEGQGHLWCIDPTKRGDVSPSLVFNAKDEKTPIAPKRLQALVAKDGDLERANPNSAAVWHYMGSDPKVFETTMHRTCGTVAIKNDLLFVADFSGVFHCVNAKTGEAHWTYDMLAASWASPLIINDKVYIGDEDGDIAVFEVSYKEQTEPLAEINMGSAVYTTPVFANETLYIANRNRIFAIAEGAKSEPADE
jgi:outer membrane protein assembly factor BamB